MSLNQIDIELTPTEIHPSQGIADSEEKMIETQNPSTWKEQKALLWQAVPLALLLISSVFVQNILSILLLIAMIAAFESINDFLVGQSELPRGVSVLKSSISILYLIGCCVIAYPVVSMFWLFSLNSLNDWLGNFTPFWSTLFMVTVTDFLFKYLTISLKCVVLILSGRLFPVRLRGRTFMAMEGISQIVRCLLPVPQWSKYILMSDMCVSTILCFALVIFYLAVKFTTIRKKYALIASSWRYNMLTGAKFHPVDMEEMLSSKNGRLCPLCHDKYFEPTSIPCGHVFCQACISIWFDREQHCPVCASNSINSLILGLQSELPPAVHYTSSNSKWKTGTTDFVIQFF